MSASIGTVTVPCPACGQLLEVPVSIKVGPELAKALDIKDVSASLKPDNAAVVEHVRSMHPEMLPDEPAAQPADVGLAGGGQLPNERPERGKGGENL